MKERRGWSLRREGHYAHHPSVSPSAVSQYRAPPVCQRSPASPGGQTWADNSHLAFISQAFVEEELLPTHGARVPHVHQAVHAEGDEAAAQEAPAASEAAGTHWGPSQACEPPTPPLGLPGQQGGLGNHPSLHAPCQHPPKPAGSQHGCPGPQQRRGGTTHPATKMPVHRSQVSMPGTGVVTVTIRFMQYGHVNCTGSGDCSLGTLNSSWGRDMSGPTPHPRPPHPISNTGARPSCSFSVLP